MNQRGYDKNALDLAKTIDVNGEEEFQRVHCMRKLPKNVDDNPDITAEITLYPFYRKEMNLVLDTMINVLKTKCENTKLSFNDFYGVLDPNITEYDTETLKVTLKN